MRDNIPDALIAAFERQYDTTWNDPQLRNERMAMRYGWAAAMEAKPCLHQIQEPAPITAMDALREAEAALEVAMARILKEDPGNSICVTSEAKALVAVRAALAATPAEKSNSVEFEGIKTAAPVVLPEPAAIAISKRESTTKGTVEFTWGMDAFRVEGPHTLYTEQQMRALLATGGQAKAVERIVIDMKQTAELLDLFGGEATEFTVMQCNGHSGPGLYAYVTEYPEDGASFLGKTDSDATPTPQQADARDADGMYYLQNARHSAMVGNCPSWWRPDGNGYTTNLDEAARFTFDEAMAQHRCRDTDLPWLCSEVDKLRRTTVDCQYMPRSWDAQRESIAAIAAAKGE